MTVLDGFAFVAIHANLLDRYKTILWGWNGNKYAAFGGATYLANGVADLDDSGIWNHCYDKAEINFSDLSAILPGEVLWMSDMSECTLEMVM